MQRIWNMLYELVLMHLHCILELDIHCFIIKGTICRIFAVKYPKTTSPMLQFV